MEHERLDRLIERIDQLNSEDPNRELIDGVLAPRELVYARRLSAWVLRLCPSASEALRIAARGQHVCRWMIPRSQYPMTRQGYLRWRETLKTFHAERVTTLMQEGSYPPDIVQSVRSLIVKRCSPADPEAQALEDALCLIFFEIQYAPMRQKAPEDKLRDVVKKVWQKMSPKAREEVLRLALSDEDRAVLQRAIAA